MVIFVQFGIGATIRIGREIQCIQYAGFTISFWFKSYIIIQRISNRCSLPGG